MREKCFSVKIDTNLNRRSIHETQTIHYLLVVGVSTPTIRLENYRAFACIESKKDQHQEKMKLEKLKILNTPMLLEPKYIRENLA